MAFLNATAARRFTATLAATATALALIAATAVPARADRQSDDFAKAVAAIAAIAIVGSALTAKDDHRDHRATVQPNPRVQHSHREPRRGYVEPQRHHRGRMDQRLPRECEVSIGRGRTAYDQHCLKHSGYYAQGRRR